MFLPMAVYISSCWLCLLTSYFQLANAKQHTVGFEQYHLWSADQSIDSSHFTSEDQIIPVGFHAHQALSASAHHALVTISTLAVIAFAAGVLWRMGSGQHPASESLPDCGIEERKLTRQRRTLQGLFLIAQFLRLTHGTVVIPSSHRLAINAGRGAAFSGWVISSAWALSAMMAPLVGAWMMPWSQFRNRWTIILTTIGFTLVALVYAVAANPPMSWGWSDNARMGMLVASRIAMGLCSCPQEILLRVMIQYISPQTELVSLMLYLNCAVSLGTGFGPLLSTMVCETLEVHGVRAEAAMPSCAIAVLWCGLAVAFWFHIPEDLKSLVLCKQAKDDQEPVRDHVSCSTSESGTSSRSWIWILGACNCVERAMTVAALEAAISLILEVKFHLSHQEIGLAICATFAIGAPFALVTDGLRQRGWLADTTLLCMLMFVCLLSSSLLFTGTERAAVLGSDALWLLLTASFLTFSTAYMANGIAEGLALKYAMPAGKYSQESFAMTRPILTDLVGRLFGAPLARYLIDLGGQDAYASFQLSLVSISCFGALKIRHHVHSLITAAELGGKDSTSLLGNSFEEKRFLHSGTTLAVPSL